MQIFANSKLFDVLTAYPDLEPKIVQAAPVFKNLTNPVLRRTVGRLATIEKVAQVGGLDPAVFVNWLRAEVGQFELAAAPSTPPADAAPPAAGAPDWIDGQPQFVVDGASLLASGEVPLNQVNRLLPQLDPGRHLLLLTQFEPLPLIDALRQQGRLAHCRPDPDQPGQFLTAIQ